ncbi:uroporphyrinogen decarboxylase [Terrihabitans soli]|uniref:Uroporphyrinogen decarboxylase n=1 Tax=Terrihabitans soli TaxID=708113 RepID=A0A6S6QN23_9HYPH|nr:uroporphyrinogen decarboxylase [Terrihabitans soli]
MRQAGRYLPEYRELRAKAGSFLDLCYTPDFAAEVTLQPIRRFGFDAAILFSDILIIPHALGLKLDFLEGEGPKLETVTSAAELPKLSDRLDTGRTGKVYEAIGKIRAALPSETTLIGFVGGPWTVATYVVAGGSSPDHAEARMWALRDPDGFGQLIARLVDASVEHLSGQISAGAEAVQVFDSWAGELPDAQFQRWCIAPLKEIVSRLHKLHPGTPVIVFPRAAGTKLAAVARAIPEAAIGLDTAESPAGVDALLPSGRPVQGNLDPLVLIAGGAALDAEIDRIRQGFAGRPHIFNLGHGIKPETPIAHVERLVARLRESA